MARVVILLIHEARRFDLDDSEGSPTTPGKLGKVSWRKSRTSARRRMSIRWAETGQSAMGSDTSPMIAVEDEYEYRDPETVGRSGGGARCARSILSAPGPVHASGRFGAHA